MSRALVFASLWFLPLSAFAQEAAPAEGSSGLSAPGDGPVVPPGYEGHSPPPSQLTPQLSQPIYAGPPRRVRIRYTEGMEIPAGAELIARPRMGMLISGIALFAGSYLLWVSVAVLALVENAASYIPIVGPFVAMSEFSLTEDKLLLGIFGVAQLVGIPLFVLGVVMKKRFLQMWQPGIVITGEGATIGLRHAF